jgi:hypothetical protein
MRKTVASFLDDSDVSARKISDQSGRARDSMAQDRYLGCPRWSGGSASAGFARNCGAR